MACPARSATKVPVALPSAAVDAEVRCRTVLSDETGSVQRYGSPVADRRTSTVLPACTGMVAPLSRSVMTTVPEAGDGSGVGAGVGVGCPGVTRVPVAWPDWAVAVTPDVVPVEAADPGVLELLATGRAPLAPHPTTKIRTPATGMRARTMLERLHIPGGSQPD